MPTADLPRISARNGAAFDPAQALTFGSEVLAWMWREAAARPGQHLRFAYEPSSGGSSAGGVIRCELLPDGLLPGRLKQCIHDSAAGGGAVGGGAA